MAFKENKQRWNIQVFWLPICILATNKCPMLNYKLELRTWNELYKHTTELLNLYKARKLLQLSLRDYKIKWLNAKE